MNNKNSNNTTNMCGNKNNNNKNTKKLIVAKNCHEPLFQEWINGRYQGFKQLMMIADLHTYTHTLDGLHALWVARPSSVWAHACKSSINILTTVNDFLTLHAGNCLVYGIT